jgi:anti-anti-sigma regulatory factor
MFTITVLSNPPGPRTLALAGSLSADAVHEIDRLIKDFRQTPSQVVLDMGEVTLMDRAAVRFFARQLKRGVELVNCPGYIKHWISRETTAHEQQK